MALFLMLHDDPTVPNNADEGSLGPMSAIRLEDITT
jgi:hypothetical protein